MDRIIHDLANSSTHLNYSRFLDLIVDHERNPNQLSHGGWPGQPPTEMPNTAYEFSAPKAGPSYPYSAGRHDSLHSKQLNHLENLARNDPYKYNS